MTAAQLSIESAGRSGPDNMARDMALLREARPGRALIRLYRWDPACLSFGRHEAALVRYDTECIDALGLAVVRRPTGGRAVWHAAEVTYAIAGHVGDFGSLRATYAWIHHQLATALRELGVPASLAPSHSPAGTEAGPACFAAPIGGEVVVGSRKLVGSAQVRDGDAFLQHGSILLDDEQDVIARITRGPASAPDATSVTRVLGRPVAFHEVADAVAHAMQAAFESVSGWEPPPPAAADLARFADPHWTWRR